MANILVAGGAGFIGSHLVEDLLRQGHHVVAVDSFVTGRRENLATAMATHGAGTAVSAGLLRLVEWDICNPLIGQPAFDQKFDQIYNLASPASPVDFTKMPVFILHTSSLGHGNLLELAKRDRARILVASTSEVYGDPLVHPQVESYFGNVNTIGPRGCYDEAKRFAEALSMAYFREHKVDIRIARIFNTYGPRMRPEDGRIIPNFFTQGLGGEALTIYGDGKQTRSFCYVTDLAKGLIALMEKGDHEPVNLGNPLEQTVLEMALVINKLTNNAHGVRHLPLPENDPLRRKPDISRAKSRLGWEPTVGLEAGLKSCLEFFKSAL